MIKTDRLLIDELKIEDVYDMFKWKRNRDLLIKEYDFLDASDGDPELWYDYRMNYPRLKSYAVRSISENKTIGFISIRNINRIFKSAILGITFDENYLGMGYGTEALVGFLDYYFNTMNMKTMLLDVGKYNFRALKCYRKLGFEVKREYKVVVPKQFKDMKHELIKDPAQAENRTYILLADLFILVYYRMKLKNVYFNRIQNNCG